MCLFNQMCKNLKQKSLVSKVFAFVSCRINEPLLQRYLNKKGNLLSQVDVHGDMQSEKMKHSIVIIIIKFQFIC